MKGKNRNAIIREGQICIKEKQNLAQNIETGCQKLVVVNFRGVFIFKGDHNMFM